MKESLIAHGEKLAVGICVLALCYFGYVAWTAETYNKTPQDFEKSNNRAMTRAKGTKLDEEKVKWKALPEIEGEINQDVDHSEFAWKNRMFARFDVGSNFRQEPTILAPEKIYLQANKGVLSLFKTDEKCNRVTRKVPKDQGVFVVAADDSDDNHRINIDQQNVRRFIDNGEGPNPNMPATASFGNTGDIDYASRLMENRLDKKSRADFDKRVKSKREIGVKANGAGRFVDTRGSVTKKVEDKGGDDEVEMVDEYIETMKPKHWVEIVAPFPQEKQIKEYVRALREPAKFVGLRYKGIEVERRELQADQKWGPWVRVSDIMEQKCVMTNGVAYEDPPYPQVETTGLSYPIPLIQSLEKPFLIAPELKKVQLADYTQEEMRPKEHDFRKRAAASGNGDGAVGFKFIDSPKFEKEGKIFDNRHQLKYSMIRYWDYTVKPGHRYQYRLRVVVWNPNFDRDDVAEAAFSTRLWLQGPWTETKAEIYVEPDSYWYVDNPDRGIKKSKNAVIEVQEWYDPMGEWVVNRWPLDKGQWLGGPASKQPNKVIEFDDENKAWKVQDKVLDKAFQDPVIVLDVEGGSMKGRITAKGKAFQPLRMRKFVLPFEVVAMNEFGDLVRRTADDDAKNERRLATKKRYDDLKKSLATRGSDKKDPKDPGKKDPNGGTFDPTK